MERGGPSPSLAALLVVEVTPSLDSRVVELHRTLAFVSVRFVSFAAVKTQLSGKLIVLIESIYGWNFILSSSTVFNFVRFVPDLADSAE